MFYIGIISLVFLDLFTKFLAKTYLGEKIHLMGDFLFLKYVENNGIAFSIQITGIPLKILTLILIGIIFIYYIKEEKIKKSKMINISFACILGGALGNGYERIVHSQVIDFIGIQYFSVFNIADICISIGVILYIYSTLLLNKKSGTPMKSFDQEK